MGKLKLDYLAQRGIFLAPKSYVLCLEDDTCIMKKKGPTNDIVTSEWFQRVLVDRTLKKQLWSSSNFRID